MNILVNEICNIFYRRNLISIRIAMKFGTFILGLSLVSVSQTTVNGQRGRNHEGTSGDENTTQILDAMFENYDHRVHPGFGGRSVNINMTIYVLAFHKVDDISNEFTTQMYFRQEWIDPRLRYNSNSRITLDGDHGLELWTPDLFFVNEISIQTHHYAKENTLLLLSPLTGTVKISERITVSTQCPMNLLLFPFDKVVCSLEIESFGHSTKDIMLNWGSESSVGVSSDAVGANGFRYIGHRSNSTIIRLRTGNYSRVWVEFVFERDFAWHFWTIHVPVGIFTLLSILPRMSVFQNVGPDGNSANPAGWKMMSTTFAYLVGLWAYNSFVSGNNGGGGGPVFARAYVYLNWGFVTMTLLDWIVFSCVGNGDRQTGTINPPIKKLGWQNCLRKEKGFVITLTIFVLMNIVYWVTLFVCRSLEEPISNLIISG